MLRQNLNGTNHGISRRMRTLDAKLRTKVGLCLDWTRIRGVYVVESTLHSLGHR